MDLDGQNYVRSIGRALSVLNALACGSCFNLGEISQKSGVTRGATRRILKTLETEGYVMRDSVGRVYRLTGQVLNLASAYLHRDILIDQSRELMEELTVLTGWPTIVTCLNGFELEVLFTTEKSSPLSLREHTVGSRHEMLETAAGHAILESMDDYQRNAYMCKLSLRKRMTLSNNSMAVSVTDNDTELYVDYSPPESREGSIATVLRVMQSPIGALSIRYIRSAINGKTLDTEIAPTLLRAAAEINASIANVIEEGLLKGGGFYSLVPNSIVGGNSVPSCGDL